jgi:hypothetical protein
MKNYILYFFLFSNIIWSQENTRAIQKETIPKEGFKIIAKLNFELVTNFYFGKNYLAKGHANPAIGGNFRLDFYQYNNFKLGVSLGKSTIKVSDFSIGGNINRTNINNIGVNLLYDYNISEKVSISPAIKYCGVQLRQHTNSQFYGSQNGSIAGLSVDLNYNVDKNIKLYTNIGYNRYFLNVKTSQEFQSYFDNSNAINFTFGIKL